MHVSCQHTNQGRYNLMAIESHETPRRVGELERQTDTIKYRLDQLEESHRDMPHRMTVLELAVERLPKIEVRLDGMYTRLNQILFTIAGFGGAFAMWQIGPDIIKFLGGR